MSVTLALLLSTTVHATNAPEPREDLSSPPLAMTTSQASLFDGRKDPLRYGIEYRFDTIGTLEMYPVAGITTAANGATFVYADVRRDFWMAEHLVFTPSFGLGRFDPDDVLDLGTLLEFRSGVSLGYQFDENYRIELGLFHFSNGGIANRNPGTEVLTLSFAFSLP